MHETGCKSFSASLLPLVALGFLDSQMLGLEEAGSSVLFWVEAGGGRDDVATTELVSPLEPVEGSSSSCPDATAGGGSLKSIRLRGAASAVSCCCW